MTLIRSTKFDTGRKGKLFAWLFALGWAVAVYHKKQKPPPRQVTVS